jgi:hypothetical protein
MVSEHLRDRILPVLVTIIFLITSVLPGSVHAGAVSGMSHGKNLAAASVNSGMLGVRHRDVGLIKVSLQRDLLDLFENTQEEECDFDTYKQILGRRAQKDGDLFTPEGVHIFHHEAVREDGRVRVMCRVRDGEALRTYYVCFSLSRDGDNGFPIEIITAGDPDPDDHGRLPGGFPDDYYEWVPGEEGRTIRDRSNHSILFTRTPEGTWSAFSGGLPVSGDDLTEEIFLVIGVSGMTVFYLHEYGDMYEQVRTGHPELNLPRLEDNWQESVGTYLDYLVEHEVLDLEKIGQGQAFYQIRHSAADLLPPVLDKLDEDQLGTLVTRTHLGQICRGSEAGGDHRDTGGRFRDHRGKSPADTLKVIALSGLSGRSWFTLRDYFHAYREISRSMPGLGLEELSFWWQGTVRNDLYRRKDSLEAEGLIEKVRTGGMYRFSLTREGLREAERISRDIYGGKAANGPAEGNRAEVAEHPGSRSPYAGLADSLAGSPAWKRLGDIGAFLPSGYRVRGDGYGVINSRMRHVLRGLEAARMYAQITGTPCDDDLLRALAYSCEMGRLPFTHFAEKRAEAYLGAAPSIMIDMSVGNRVSRRFNQSMAQKMVYKRYGLDIPGEIAADIDAYLLKRPEEFRFDETRLLFLADEMMSFVEDLILSFKLVYKGERLIGDMSEWYEFYEYIFGPSMEPLEELKLEDFEEFASTATVLLMERVVDGNTLHYRKKEIANIRRYKDKLNDMIFPIIDELVRTDSVIKDMLGRAVNELMSRQRGARSQAEKQKAVLAKLLLMSESEMAGIAGLDIESISRTLDWYVREQEEDDTAGSGGRYFIGMSMGGSKLYVALYRSSPQGVPVLVEGRPVEWSRAFGLTGRRQAGASVAFTPDRIVEKTAEVINGLLDGHDLSVDDLASIGSSTPGPISAERGIIGLNSRTINLPFRNYPYVRKLASALDTDEDRIRIEHDARSGLEGELALGLLRGVDNGYYVIQGTGLGGAISMDGQFLSSFGELTEPGHHIVGVPDDNNMFEHHFRFIGRKGKKHPWEVTGDPERDSDTNERSKEYQISYREARDLISSGREKPENLIWFGSGERDLEDLVSGNAIERLLNDKHRLWVQFAGEYKNASSVVDAFNTPGDISELAINGTEIQKKIGRRIIRYLAGELGRGLATLIDLSMDRPWQISRIVIGSTVGEKMGLDSSGNMLLTDSGEDYYYHHIRAAASEEMVERYGMDADDADMIAGQIMRSELDQQIRETAGFLMAGGENARKEDDLGWIKEMLLDLVSTSGDYEGKAVIHSILMHMGHETESQKYKLREIMDDIGAREDPDVLYADISRRARRVRSMIGEVLREHADPARPDEGKSRRENAADFLEKLSEIRSLDYESKAVARFTLFFLGRDPDTQLKRLEELAERASAILRQPHISLNADVNKARQVREIYRLASESPVQSGNGSTKRYVNESGGRRTTMHLDGWDVDMQIDDMGFIAERIGRDMAPPVCYYTLFVSSGMFRGREYHEDRLRFRDRFDLKRIATDDPRLYVDRVLTAIKEKDLDPRNVVVQLPSCFSRAGAGAPARELLKKAPGIRFIVMDTDGLRGERTRLPYRRYVYCLLLAMRKMDGDRDAGSNLYRFTRFLLKRLMGEEGQGIDRYIEAVASGKVRRIMRIVLSYKPAGRYRSPKYDVISKTLISA